MLKLTKERHQRVKCCRSVGVQENFKQWMIYESVELKGVRVRNKTL